ncbi:biotin transporter BioY [Bacillus sp. 1P06AnD]|uniref:biotin transporter BioY n=1 Tax=Bacillus sp. 1P06AnD TaxID=3132208 RepID=UPI0039A2D704
MKVRDMTQVALFAAIMGVLGLLPPITLGFTPVPITMQTIGVMLAGGILGAKRGGGSLIVFLLIVAAGLPLLSGGRGGPSVFVGPSAGYLFGYIPVAFLIGYSVERMRKVTFFKMFIVNVVFGIILLYACGVTVQAFVMDLSIIHVLKISLVFLPGDFLKIVLSSYLVYRIRKSKVIVKQLGLVESKRAA